MTRAGDITTSRLDDAPFGIHRLLSARLRGSPAEVGRFAPTRSWRSTPVTKLDFEPGERWSYSNTGYTLLGRVVAKVSGKPFGQFLKERILDPVGMKHSAFEPGPEVNGPDKGLHVVCPGAARARGARGPRLAARGGRPVGVCPGPRAVGPRADGRPRLEARVVPPHDHAASAQERPHHGLWLRPECPPGWTERPC